MQPARTRVRSADREREAPGDAGGAVILRDQPVERGARDDERPGGVRREVLGDRLAKVQRPGGAAVARQRDDRALAAGDPVAAVVAGGDRVRALAGTQHPRE